jgi:class 3 adenylate cyclase/tetratricopeptide (TPR) repeat protein
MQNLADRPERSIVTILAVDTVNSTGQIAAADPDDAQELLDRIFNYLDGAVRRAGGLFVSYAGDGGCAVFGWPQSMEDHADRACQVAWTLQHPTEKDAARDDAGRPFSFRIGVHSGLVGLRRLGVGADDRLDSVGGTVHLAAALQKAAVPGSVLVSSRTVELCQSALDLSPQSDHALLARIGAKVFRLEGEPRRLSWRSERSYRSPLIGREEERTTLREVILSRGSRRSAAVTGPPGIGKSRLAAVAIDDAVADGQKVVAFYGDSQKRTTPYAAMRSIILEAMSLDDAAGDEDISHAMRGIGIADPAANPASAVMLAKRPQAPPGTGTWTQTQIARALIAALDQAAGEQPGLVVVEDLHVVDLESLECLRLLADSPVTCWVLLMTARPEADADVERIAAVVVRLDVLPRETMHDLAVALWPRPDPPAALIDRMLDRAEGNPFILEQIVLSTGTEGSSPPDLAPQRVQSVIHARLNRLSASAKACAQTLGLLGEEVETDVALKVLGIEPEELLRDRRELELLEIVHRSEGPGIRFRHAIVAEASAETLPRPRRQEIHQAAIGAITAIYPDLGPHYERLAFHAEGARDDDKALEYLWFAGQHARRSAANGSLFLIFERGVACAARLGERAEVKLVDFILMAAMQLMQAGDIEKMKPHLPRALELALRQNRPDRVSSALSAMGTVSWFEGRYEESRAECERALAIGESLNNLPIIFAAKFMLASARWGLAQVEEAIALQFELREVLTGKLETARLGAPAIPSVMVGSYISWFMMEVGRYAEGLPYAERALEIAVRQGDPYSEIMVRNGLGRNLMKLKRPAEAAACLEIAIDLIERYGYDAIRPHVTGNFATALARSGQAERAVRLVDALLGRGLEARATRVERYYLEAGYAEALSCLGRHDDARAAIDRAIALAQALPNPCLIVQGLGLRAHLVARVDPSAPAIERDLEEQEALCRRHGLVAEQLGPPPLLKTRARAS